ncbi:hypothetical protein GCM10010446_03230 [Streptomyces enissocaesilis]|uniref:Uncharacterized protein n=1 Tax=Streptomyces enissocaesilis TaxID=332589 RepID=A0ABP6J5V6_9ACTN
MVVMSGPSAYGCGASAGSSSSAAVQVGGADRRDTRFDGAPGDGEGRLAGGAGPGRRPHGSGPGTPDARIPADVEHGRCHPVFPPSRRSGHANKAVGPGAGLSAERRKGAGRGGDAHRRPGNSFRALSVEGGKKFYVQLKWTYKEARHARSNR